MKARFSMLGLLFVSLSMVGLPTLASTPDGQTPTEETVCDPLTEDDVSQGLYGLCIAFCEAQDIADEEVPITEDELAALLGAAPSGSILDAYNNIKNADDPDMPCIVVDSACPCWTEEELAAIDGVIPGVSAELRCTISPEIGLARVDEFEIFVQEPPQLFSFAAVSEQVLRCTYRSNQDPAASRTLELSPGQAAVCAQQVTDHCLTLGY